MSNRRVTAIVTLAGLMDLCLAGGCHVADRARHRHDHSAGYSYAADCNTSEAPGRVRITDDTAQLEPHPPVAPPAETPVPATPDLPDETFVPETVEEFIPPKADIPVHAPRDPVIVDKPADDIELKSPDELELKKQQPSISTSETPVQTAPEPAPMPEIEPAPAKEPAIAAIATAEGIAALKKAGAVLKFDKSWDPFTEKETPSSVIGVDLSNSQFGDADIRHLAGMKNLRELDLSGTQVSNESIKSILSLDGLELLWLNGTKVNDDGVAEIASLKGLKSLGLANTSVGDDGIKHLAGMSNLEYLLLAHTKVTDEGIDSIRELSHLRGLSLMGTDVSEQGAKTLREALPNCQVVLDPKNEQGAMPIFRKRPFAKMPRILAATRVRDAKPLPVPQPKQNRHDGFNTSDDEMFDAKTLDAEGQALAAGEQWEAAIVVLSKAVKAAPNDVHIRHHLAVALARAGHVDAAMPHFMKSVGEAEAHYNVGVILYESGDLEASELQLVQALRKNPNLEVAQQQLDDVRLELKAARTVGRTRIRSISN